MIDFETDSAKKHSLSIVALLLKASFSSKIKTTKLCNKLNLHHLRQLHSLSTTSGLNPTAFSFNHLIRAHTLLSSPIPALLHLRRLLRRTSPDSHTFPFALAAASLLPPPHHLSAAKAIHSQALRLGFAADSFLLNSLIRIYSLPDARRLFSEAQSNLDIVSYNTLLDKLVKSGEISQAQALFDEMPRRDSISWGTMIAGLSHHGDCDSAIRLFFDMIGSGIPADNIAIVSALSSCAQTGDLERGKLVHNYITDKGIELDPFLTTGLIDLYSKCGCIDTAKVMFDSSSEKCKNLFTWNAMIFGFAVNGLGQLSLTYFHRMMEEGVERADGATVVAVLTGCSHAGLVEEARDVFERMECCYGVRREAKHYGCMADVFGRKGLVGEAAEMIRGMPAEMRGDLMVWGGLLGGCRVHGMVGPAEMAAEWLKKDDEGVNELMAAVYGESGRWEEVGRLRMLAMKMKMNKRVGVSLIRL